MEVGIVGTFDLENYGDLLFPLIAEFELYERLGEITLHRFSYHARTLPEWPYTVTSVAELPDIIQRLDVLLIGGGDLIRFDKEIAPGYAPPAEHIHHPTGFWLTPALIAHAHGVPVVWNAPGVFLDAIPTWVTPVLELTLALTPYLAVRDHLSKAALVGLVDGDRIELVPDTAFGISRLLSSGTDVTRPYIVIQPARSVAEFIAFVKAHAARFAGYELLALPIGPVLGDDPAFLADVPDIACLPAWPDPLQLAQIISNASAVVGPSYHLAITALTAGVPVFTPADLDAGKYMPLRDFETVHRFMEARESNPDWFFSRLGRTAPAESVRVALSDLSTHWDRIAAITAAGRLPTEPAFGRFMQSLPALLEGGARRD